jgi:hypothetical protein
VRKHDRQLPVQAFRGVPPEMAAAGAAVTRHWGIAWIANEGMWNMLRSVLAAVGFVLLSGAPARADLINLGNGMIYDTLQDLTWLQDARYAQTSGVDSDGKLPFAEAVAWAASLEFDGIDDWRLPRFLALPGPSATTSELAGLFAQLGWEAGPHEYTHVGDFSPFVNVLTPGVDRYWLDNAFNIAWHEYFVFDIEDAGVESPQGAWAVRQGAPAARVSEPSTLLMFGAGIIALTRRLRR